MYADLTVPPQSTTHVQILEAPSSVKHIYDHFPVRTQSTIALAPPLCMHRLGR